MSDYTVQRYGKHTHTCKAFTAGLRIGLRIRDWVKTWVKDLVIWLLFPDYKPSPSNNSRKCCATATMRSYGRRVLEV